MKYYSRLKRPRAWIIPVIINTILFGAAVELKQTGVPGYGVLLFGTFFIILGIIDFYRTRMITELALGILLGTGSWHLVLAVNRISIFSEITTVLHLVIIPIFLFLTWPILGGQRKLNKNARSLFQLAAELIFETSNGFTSRPYSAGNAEYSREEILRFARFLSGNNIVRSVIQEKTITLIFSMGISPLSEPELAKVSYVAYDAQGNVSVHISEYDYRQYKDTLSFDQLCTSLGELFKRFLEYYQEGKENRILTELKSVQ